MTGAEILALVMGASRLVVAGVEIFERLTGEGRTELTPEEIEAMAETIEAMKAAQTVAEEGWAAQLERLRAAAADD